MKKVIIILAAVILTAGAWAKPSPLLPSENQTVAQAFVKEFSEATNVQWSNVEDVYVVKFTLNNEQMRAWFTADGEMAAVQRDVQKEQMTYLSAKTVLQLAEEQTILSIAEISKQGELYYIVKTENDSYKSLYKLSASGEASRIERKKKK